MNKSGCMCIRRLLIFLLIISSSLTAEERHEQVVILGSGPSGMSAAIYTARANLSTLVLETAPPEEEELSYVIDNYPGFPQGISGFQLQQKMREQATRFGAKIEQGDVKAIDLSHRPFAVTMEEGETIYAETLIVALGTIAKPLGIESEKSLTGYGVSLCTVCDAFLYTNKEVVVVGDGDLALQEALTLANYASKITLIPQGGALKASKIIQNKLFSNPKIQILWNYQVADIKDPIEKNVTGVVLKGMISNDVKFYPCDGVFVAVGTKPNSDLFKGQLDMDQNGYIITKDHTMHTSVPGVFAAGNIADPRYRQAVIAAGMGGMAGIDAFLYIKNLEKEEAL